MNEEMRKLLKKINDKKNEVKSLVVENKLDKAQAAKDELKELQAKFDILADLEDEENAGIQNSIKNGSAKDITGGQTEPSDKETKKKNLVKSFVNIVRCGFLHQTPDDTDVTTYKNALTSDITAGEDGSRGMGVVIPDDIRTDIIELRRSEDNLEQYVNVEGVSTNAGSRNVEVDADATPFDNVDEAAEFPDMDEPKFKLIQYKIKKKGGILKATAELFEDAAINVMAYINKWIAKKTKATRNAVILKKLDEITKGKEKAVSNIDSLKDIFNDELDPAIAEMSICITNQSGFNYLDKLKDTDGKYILQSDPTQTIKGKLLFGEYPIVKLSKRTLKSVSGEGFIKHPIYCGSLKEAITLFDREVLTMDMNDKASGLWENDLTGIKVRDRFDVQAVDEAAVVKGEITETVAG